MLLEKGFTIDDVVIQSVIKDKKEVIKEMTYSLCNQHGLDVEKKMLEAVYTREEKMSTGIGLGVAIPHAKVDFIDKIYVFAMTMKEPIEFNSIDKKLVNLIFLIVSPLNLTGHHIRLLSFISRMMSSADIREGLVGSNSKEDFFNILKEEEMTLKS